MTNANGRCPQLRIAVTPKCNLHCFYCRPEGEGWANNPRDVLTTQEVQCLIKVAAKVGFSYIKFTGGEPLLRKDISELVRAAANTQEVQEVQLVTNGILLERHAAQLCKAGLSSITLSIDAATPELYKQIRGGDLKLVMRGIRECQSVGLPVRINTVISRLNLSEIPKLMDLARQFGTSLKLLDLFNVTAPEGDGEWLKQFVSFAEVRTLIEKSGGKYVGLEQAPGGIGAPLLEFRMPDGLQVVIKDSMFGTCYSDSCASCPKYPCQDAIISLRVTHDGYLKKCLIREDNMVPVGHLVRSKRLKEAEDRFRTLFREYLTSTFVHKAWQPPAADHASEGA